MAHLYQPIIPVSKEMTVTCKPKTIEPNCPILEVPKDSKKTLPAAASDYARSPNNAGLAPCMLDVPRAESTHSRGTMVRLFYVETYKMVPGVEEIADREHPEDMTEVADKSK